MVKSRGDSRTLDLLAWEPPEIVRHYDECRVRAATLKVKVARAVSETLRESGRPRGEIARAMSDFLGERITKNMLDAYASEARTEHTIAFVRLVALVVATGDPRPLQVAAESIGHSVVDDKYLRWIEVGMRAEAKIHSDREYEAAIRAARKDVGGGR